MKEKDSLLIKYYFQEKNLEEYKENEKVISMYYEYIKKVIELFDFLLYYKSDLFYATFFNVLVHASFFTLDKNFIRSEENLKETR